MRVDSVGDWFEKVWRFAHGVANEFGSRCQLTRILGSVECVWAN